MSDATEKGTTSDGHDPLLTRAAAVLRRKSPRDDTARAAVVRLVRDEATGERASTGERDRPLRSRLTVPLLATAATAIFALGVATGVLLRAPADGLNRTASDARAGGDSVSRAERDAQVVEFVFVAPRARSVSLVGEFNGWDATATPMRSARDGVWTVSLLLVPGRHVYAFVVDGSSWLPDPEAPIAPERWFGSRNSVVVAPTSSRL